MKNGGTDAVFHARSDALYPGASAFRAVRQNGHPPAVSSRFARQSEQNEARL